MYYTEMQMLLIKLLKCVKWSCTVSEKTAPHGQFGPYLKSIYYMWTLHLQRRGKGIDYIKSPKKNSEEYLLEVKTLIWTDLSKGIKTKKLTQNFFALGLLLITTTLMMETSESSGAHCSHPSSHSGSNPRGAGRPWSHCNWDSYGILWPWDDESVSSTNKTHFPQSCRLHPGRN